MPQDSRSTRRRRRIAKDTKERSDRRANAVADVTPVRVSHGVDNEFDEFNGSARAQERRILIRQPVLPDDVHQVPAGERRQLATEQRLALAIDRKRVEYAF